MKRPSSATPSALQLTWFGGVLAVMTALAAASAWPMYEVTRAVLVAVVGAALGAGIAWLASWRSLSVWASAALALVVYALAVVPLAIPSALGDPGRIIRGVVEGLTAVVTSWKLLLTVSLPAADYQAVMVPLLVVCLGGAWAAATIVLRSTTKAAFATVPMLAMVVFGLAFGPVAGSAQMRVGPIDLPSAMHVAISVASLVVLAAWLLGRERIQRRSALALARSKASTVHQSTASVGASARRGLLGATMLIAALAVAGAAVPVVDELPRRSGLRDDVVPQEVFQEQPSPLSAYRSWFGAELFDTPLMSVSAGSSVERVRLVTLDSYNGVSFRVSPDAATGSFLRQPGNQSGQVTFTIREGYSGPWVPLTTAEGGAPQFLGPRAEQLADAYYASTRTETGVVSITDDSGQGLRTNDKVRAASVTFPVATADALGTVAGGDPLISAEQYPSLAAWVEEQELGRTGADLVELVKRLRLRGYLSHSSVESQDSSLWTAALGGYTFESSRPGHSSARIESLFGTLLEQQRRAGAGASDRELISAVGDDEQFATATALLARYLGFESRVVIGFRMVPDELSDAVAACTETCTGANVTAWVEVLADGQWFSLDASPQVENEPIRIRQGENPPKNPTVPLDPEAKAIEPPQVATDTSKKVESSNQEDVIEDDVRLQWVGKAAAYTGAGVLALLPLAVFPIALAIRRGTRRKDDEPELSLVGAWAELMDTYLDAGIDVPTRLTRGEIADVVDRPAAAALAALVDRGVFAEHVPARDASELAWQLVGDEKRELRGTTGLGRRVRATLLPPSSLHRAAPRSQTQFSTTPGRRK